MKILITGTGTLLGNTVVKHLEKNFLNIIATYNNHFPNNLKTLKNVRLIRLDLKKKIKKNFNIDVLIHCASAVPSYNFSKSEIFKINFLGLKNLLNKISIKKCKKIILISTMSVYGEINKNLIDENYVGSKISQYGKSKIKMEKYLLKFSKNKKIVPIILRLPGIVGLKSQHNFISKMIENIKNGNKIYFSNPNFRFNNIIHVKNIAEIINKSIYLESKPIIYNLASKNPIKLISLVNNIYRNLKKKYNYEITNPSSNPFQIKLSRQLLKKYKIYSVKKVIKIICNENK